MVWEAYNNYHERYMSYVWQRSVHLLTERYTNSTQNRFPKECGFVFNKIILYFQILAKNRQGGDFLVK